MTIQVDETTPQLIEFIEHKLDSLVKWDLVQFFHRQPGMVAPATKIASMIGRDVTKVERELKEMTAAGLLDMQESSGVRVYHLASDSEIRSLVDQFVQACDNRQFREAAIYRTVTAKLQ